jgi:hypothetical protein
MDLFGNSTFDNETVFVGAVFEVDDFVDLYDDFT